MRAATAVEPLAFNIIPYQEEEFEAVHAAGSKIITASGVPALWRESRFHSRFSYLGHVIGTVPRKFEDNALTERGRDFEEVVIKITNRRYAEDFDVRQIRGYAPHPRIPGFLASPDAVGRVRHARMGIGEVKVVTKTHFEEAWLSGPPLETELQHQAQYACTEDAEHGFIAAYIVSEFGHEMVVYDTTRNQQIIDIIEEEVELCMEHVAKGELPEPDPSDHTTKALRYLYPYVDPAKIAHFDGEEPTKLFDAWVKATEARKAAAKIEEDAKNRFTAMAPDAAQIRIGQERLVKIISYSVAAHSVRGSIVRKMTPSRHAGA